MSRIDTEWRSFITCPACGQEDAEMSDYPAALRHDGDTATEECWSCGARMEITLSVEYLFSTRIAPAPASPSEHGERDG